LTEDSAVDTTAEGSSDGEAIETDIAANDTEEDPYESLEYMNLTVC